MLIFLISYHPLENSTTGITINHINNEFLDQTWHMETSESGIIIGAVNPNWSLKSISEGALAADF